MNPRDYETKLNPNDEKGFWSWLDTQHKNKSIGDGDYKFYKSNGYGYDYDFRAAFKNGLSQDANNGHWKDLGKKPNHPTFSTESKYAGYPGVNPGRWYGDKFVPGTGTNTRDSQNPSSSFPTFNPPMAWKMPSLDDTPLFHDGSVVNKAKPKDADLFRMMKGTNEARQQLDEQIKQVQQQQFPNLNVLGENG